MKNIYFLLLALVSTLTLSSCVGGGDRPMGIKGQDQLDEEILEVDLIGEKIKSMTLDEKIGQLMILGFEGRDFNDELDKKIGSLKPSGFILFGKNVGDYDRTRTLLNGIKLRNQGNIPLFLAVDEEGGVVSRLPDGIKKLPRADKIGSIEDERLIYDLGVHLGNVVKSIGYNMNFAPVMDINSNVNNPVIGSRSYGRDRDSVFRAGRQILNGMNDSGVIGCIKHFPGHGDTDVDSHTSLPRVDKKLGDLLEEEIYPFKRMIGGGVDSIMIAHILYPELDQVEPASLSTYIKEELLRRQLAYEGVIISDDMTMGAIVENQNPIQASLKFIRTGGDLVLLCHGESLGFEFLQAMRKEVENAGILEEDIDEKVHRILSLKDAYGIGDFETRPVDPAKLNQVLDEILK